MNSIKYEITNSEHSIEVKIFVAFFEKLLEVLFIRSFVIFGAYDTIFRYFSNNKHLINNEEHVMTTVIDHSVSQKTSIIKN